VREFWQISQFSDLMVRGSTRATRSQLCVWVEEISENARPG